MRNKKCCVKQNFRMDILTSQHEGFPQQLSCRYSVQSLPGYGTHNAMRCDQLPTVHTKRHPKTPLGCRDSAETAQRMQKNRKIFHTFGAAGSLATKSSD